MSIYAFMIKPQDGNSIPLENYKGQVLLIVNTATGCGFTPQYSELQNFRTCMNFTKKTVWKYLISHAISSTNKPPAATRKYTASARDVTA